MKKEEILKGLEDLVEDREKFTIDANLEWIVNHEVEVLRSAIEIIKTTPEVPAQMQFIDLLDGMPLYKWERLKNCIDREFFSQANKTLFKDSKEFRKNLELEESVQAQLIKLEINSKDFAKSLTNRDTF